MERRTPDALVACREAVRCFRERGFRTVNEQYDAQSFGDVLIDLASPKFDLRFTRDRGQYFISLRHPNDEEWFDEHAVLTLIGASDDADALVQDKWASPQAVASAIERHFEAIAAAFSEEQYEQTKERLRHIEQQRAARRFGWNAPPN